MEEKGNDIFVRGVKYETLNRNRFFVRFPKESNIQEWWVQSVKKDPFIFGLERDGTIVIKFKEIDNWGDYRFVEEMKKFNKLDNRTIIFEDLDKTGCVLAGEEYKNSKAIEIYFTPCDYNENKPKYCTVVFQYEDVSPIIKE